MTERFHKRVLTYSMITCYLDMIIHEYLCILRQKRFHSYACYHIFLVSINHSIEKIIIISKYLNLGLTMMN